MGWEVQALSGGFALIKQSGKAPAITWATAIIPVLVLGSILLGLVTVAISPHGPWSFEQWSGMVFGLLLVGALFVGATNFISVVANNDEDWLVGPNHLQFNWGDCTQPKRKTRIYERTEFEMKWFVGGEGEASHWKLRFKASTGWTPHMTIGSSGEKRFSQPEDLKKLGQLFSEITGWPFVVQQ